MNPFKVPKTFDELKVYEKYSMGFIGPFYLILGCFTVWSLSSIGFKAIYNKSRYDFSISVFVSLVFLSLGLMSLFYFRKIKEQDRVIDLLKLRRKFSLHMRIPLGVMGIGLIVQLLKYSEFSLAILLLFIFIGAETLNYFFNRALEKNFKEIHES